MGDYLELIWTFFKMGILTFGGGYAMLPILQREVVERRGWATEEELLNYYAIGQCTPGVITVNTATFIGGKRHGVPGAFLATLGMVLPSFLVLLLISAFLQNAMTITVVAKALKGIRVAVVLLILRAGINMLRSVGLSNILEGERS